VFKPVINTSNYKTRMSISIIEYDLFYFISHVLKLLSVKIISWWELMWCHFEWD